MLFRRNRVEYSDEIIDLIPLHIGTLNRELALAKIALYLTISSTIS